MSMTFDPGKYRSHRTYIEFVDRIKRKILQLSQGWESIGIGGSEAQNETII